MRYTVNGFGLCLPGLGDRYAGEVVDLEPKVAAEFVAQGRLVPVTEPADPPAANEGGDAPAPAANEGGSAPAPAANEGGSAPAPAPRPRTTRPQTQDPSPATR